MRWRYKHCVRDHPGVTMAVAAETTSAVAKSARARRTLARARLLRAVVTEGGKTVWLGVKPAH